MLIVSQDRSTIINNKNIEALGVANSKQKDNKECAIVANIISKNQYLLGEYKTEERAKEVLQEIIDIYKFNRCVGVGQKNAVYAMPEG